MAFRYSGKNWEGRSFVCPPAIRSFGQSISALGPRPSTLYDGTVASKQHDKVSPSSDHRPKPYRGPGKVRALDVTLTRTRGIVMAESIRLSQDRRVGYIINEGMKFNGDRSPYPWQWRRYLGANPHKGHLHQSTISTYDNDGSPWDLTGEHNMDGPNGEPNWDKVSDYARESWTLAWEAGILNNQPGDARDSNPQDVVNKEELMIFLNRANII